MSLNKGAITKIKLVLDDDPMKFLLCMDQVRLGWGLVALQYLTH